MLKRLAKWALGAAAAAVVFAVAANAFDEDLHAEVAAYLAARPPAVAEEHNGYFQVVGLGATEGEPHAAGRLYIAALAEAQAKRLAGQQVRWPDLQTVQLPPQLQAGGDFCAMDTGGDCRGRVRAEEATALMLLASQRQLLERYRALLEYPEYLETQPLLHHETPLPEYLPLIAGQKLFHVQAALRLEEGKALHVAYDLERSLKLSRRMLAGSTSLLGKMIAAAHARRAALFVSQILPALARADRRALGRLAETLAPLSPAERSLLEANRSEFAMFQSLMRTCAPGEASGGWLDALGCYFYQPNATLNRYYFSLHKVLMAGEAAPTQRFDELRGALRASFPWWSILYNPVGKVLLAARSGPGWSAYVARVQDVDALFRVVALQALIGERGLKGNRVPQFLAENAKRYADPYSGKAMGWDAVRGQLYFEPRGTPGLQNVGGVAKRFSAGLI